MSSTGLAAMGIATAALMLPFGVRDQAPPQRFRPGPPQPSGLTLRLDRVGVLPMPANPTSPAVAGDTLLLIDQARGVYRWTGSAATPILTLDSLPPGIEPVGPETFLNVASDDPGTTVYVVFISASMPEGIPRNDSPRPQSESWYVLYVYGFDGESLSAPRPIRAYRARWDGHTGGGLTVLADGSVLLAVGDNGDSYEDGGEASQDPGTHLAKILRIDPSTGASRVVALGVRACQRLMRHVGPAGERVSFVDPGGWVSEELNSIPAAALVTPVEPANFGWGRAAADGRSREGSFFIDRLGDAVGRRPVPDSWFFDPVAEVGRTSTEPIAVSGPVASATFSTIALLFGDLVSGSVYAVTDDPSRVRQPVHAVTLVDGAGNVTSLRALVGDARPDPRFFVFPDGAPGVLLERTGEFFRISEVR